MKRVWIAAIAALVMWNVQSAAPAFAQGGAWEQQVRQRVAETLRANSVEVQRAAQTLFDRNASRHRTVVTITVNRQGQIVSQNVTESIGILPVDGIASRLVARAAPFPSFAGSGETRSVSIPINFEGRAGGRSDWERAANRHFLNSLRNARGGDAGAAVVQAVIGPQGQVVSSRVVKSTSAAFGATALRVVQDAAPYPPPSGALAGKSAPLQLSFQKKFGIRD